MKKKPSNSVLEPVAGNGLLHRRLFLTRGASALGVARLLAQALPRVEFVEFEDLGHMGPVTHPDKVNRSIERFLERTG